MRFTHAAAAVLIAGGTLIVGGTVASGSAMAANVCKAEKLSCATTMPVGGYCQCTSRGTTEDGTVMSGPSARRPVNSTAGGCGANPSAPGCR